MYRFWANVIEPMLKSVKATKIVEVGSWRGANTLNLLKYCRSAGGFLHVIDPLPEYDTREWEEEYSGYVQFYLDLSLNALSKITQIDAVLIDGDHNWYTVYNELKQLEANCARYGCPYPLVFLHDVSWPYARRDLYYNPNQIPEEYRHEHDKKGILPNTPRLVDTGGLNNHFSNAILEGGTKNGVLTAIEDFMLDSSFDFELVKIPIFSGLGILVDANLAASSEEFSSTLSRFRYDSDTMNLLKSVEEELIATQLLSKKRAQKLDILNEEAEQLLEKNNELHKNMLSGESDKVSNLSKSVLNLTKQLEGSRISNEALRVRYKKDLHLVGLQQKGSILALRAEVALGEIKERLFVLRCLLYSGAYKTGISIFNRVKRLLGRTPDTGVGLLDIYRDQNRRIQRVEVALRSMDFDNNSFENEKRLTSALKDLEEYLTLIEKSLKTVNGAITATLHSRSFRLGFVWADSIGKLFNSRDSKKVKILVACEKYKENLGIQSQIMSVEGEKQKKKNRENFGTIIICVHNAYDDVQQCFESLVRNTDLGRHKVIIVDDGSSVDTALLLRKYALEYNFRLIRNEDALGYTCASNQGLRASTGSFAVLLNSDTITTSGWLDRLIECSRSSDKVAVVGPLSNAASWQSVPELTDSEGKWKTNSIPEGYTIEEYARFISQSSARLFPKVELVNGFCYFITSEAINAVGLLDEKSFPRGYGEEDDFSLRARALGFENLIADHCYVYHAKSKSFGSIAREELVKKSKLALQAKHTKTAIAAAVSNTKLNEKLLIARVLAQPSEVKRTNSLLPSESRKLRMGWVKPHLGVVGGVRRTLEMTNRMSYQGHDITILTPNGKYTEWMPVWSKVRSWDESLDQLPFDVLIVSDPDVIDPFLKLQADVKIVYHLAAYMLYREKSSLVERYYGETGDCIHIANSEWTADEVRRHFSLPVKDVFAGGVDRRVFYPRNVPKSHDVVFYGSRREHKGTALIKKATTGLSQLSLADQRAEQRDLARYICSGKVFVSACWHEGFNFCPLEAMSCGVPVVMTDDGGSREYARHEHNALVVKQGAVQEMRREVNRLLDDRLLRGRLIENGLRTAAEFSWHRVGIEFEEFLQSIALKKADYTTAKVAGMIS